MDHMLERMIIMQAGAQRETYGLHFTEMDRNELITYIRTMQQAAVQELGEALNEVDWKPWTTEPRQVRRNEYMNELIDVLHFWINMVIAVAGKMSANEIADEIFTRFALKNRTNAQRQVDGYDGRSAKCAGCGRALDDLGVECRRLGDQGYCAKMDSDINYLGSLDQVGADVAPLTPIKPEICQSCNQPLDEHGCEPPTAVRWGFCMASRGAVKQLPPIKLPTA